MCKHMLYLEIILVKLKPELSQNTGLLKILASGAELQMESVKLIFYLLNGYEIHFRKYHYDEFELDVSDISSVNCGYLGC